MTTDHCIDFDAKKFQVAVYRHKGIMEPVVCPDLEHFQSLKRVYDHFPGRIWCISSLTLGIHEWKKHQLRPTDAVHAETKLRLEEIGLGSVEVHPMKGRCFRRPFGRDYLVITPETTLDDWRDQVNYYEDDARTAPFGQIVEAMLHRISASIQRYERADKRLTKLGHAIVQERMDDIRRWRDSGFKERITASAGSSPPTAAAEPIAPGVDLVKVDLGEMIVPDTERDGRWPLWVERMAIPGLVAHDTVGHVVHEMSKWLYWVELFDQPVVERADRIEALLGRFVFTRHNGFVTRINDGKERDVLAQVRSAVRSASQIDRPESLELFERLRNSRSQGKYERVINIVPILERCPVADSRSTGLLPLTTYMFINKEVAALSPSGVSHEVILGGNPDLPTLDGVSQSGNTSSVSSSLTTYMFINKETSPSPQVEGNSEAKNAPSVSSSLTSYMFINKELPPTVESQVEQIARNHRMRKRDGEYPLVRFARRLLNTLWEREGTARLSNEVLVKMVGTSNPNQQVYYRRLLQQGGLIEEGKGETDYLWLTWELLEGSYPDISDNNLPQRQRSGYQPRVSSKTYRLSSRAKEAFEDYYRQVPMTGG